MTNKSQFSVNCVSRRISDFSGLHIFEIISDFFVTERIQDPAEQLVLVNNTNHMIYDENIHGCGKGATNFSTSIRLFCYGRYVRRHNYDNVGNRKSGIHVKVLNSFLLNQSNFRTNQD